MKPSKQIATWLKIDVLIVIVGLGRSLSALLTRPHSVQEYARLIPFLAGTHQPERNRSSVSPSDSW
jgi:hypothetical protein